VTNLAASLPSAFAPTKGHGGIAVFVVVLVLIVIAAAFLMAKRRK
jgi:hypothetical protein